MIRIETILLILLNSIELDMQIFTNVNTKVLRHEGQVSFYGIWTHISHNNARLPWIFHHHLP